MADVINLNRFRKEKTRAQDEKRASENRVKFGRTKAEKQAAKAEVERAARLHEAGRLGSQDPKSVSESNKDGVC